MKQLNNLISAFSAKPLILLFLLALLPTMASAQCPDNNHPHMIDLGLPSGTKWACCNVGAQKPEDYGGYYAWGETEEKDVYDWSTYIHCDGSRETCHDIGKDIARTDYDVAHVKWGGEWVMPSQVHCQELIDNCTSEWTTENGVNGQRFTGPNGASIFLPAAGICWDDEVHVVGEFGQYWSSLTESGTESALELCLDCGVLYTQEFYYGQSVRPVVAGSSTPSGIAIDETNFPDENFRNWVLEQDYGQDGVLTEAEIAGVTEIYDVAYNNISSLKGIEYFTALTYLSCDGNQLTSLDVSKNIALTDLSCQKNKLTSLDVSMNTALTSLACYGNQLTSLDVSKNTALTQLDCLGNQLTSLDVSKNTALTSLTCSFNQLTSLDISKNTALTFLDCHDNQLTSLDVSQNTALTALSCSNNQLTSLDISKNTALTLLACYGNQLTSLNVSKNTALTYLHCHSNQLTALDVSKNTALTYLACSENQLTTLDVSKNTALTELYCYRNQLTSLDVSKNTALTGLSCDINQLASLDVSKNTALTYLACGDNQLNVLDVSKNTALTVLECDDNQLTSLDVSKNTALNHLNCSGNQLTALDVSKNTVLTELYCFCNQIERTAMDDLISGLPKSGGGFYAFFISNDYDDNVVTKAQVATAKKKKWITYYWNAESQAWEEYEGRDPEIAPVDQGETIDIGNEIDENTDLDGNVVGDVYYCISSGDGSYDPEEGCIVVTKPTDDSAIDGKDIFGEDFKDGYTGFVFMVAPGKGTINVEAETTGNMVLKVKVGDNAPTQMEVDGKTKVSFSYDVSEPTMVFIYGSIGAASAKGVMKAASTDMLKIYGIEVTSETNGIEAIDNGQLTIDNSPVYNLNGQRVESSKLKVQNSKLPKGVYIQNGKKVLVK